MTPQDECCPTCGRLIKQLKVCRVDDCDKTATARGLCPKHYRRLRLYGDAQTGFARRDAPTKYDIEEVVALWNHGFSQRDIAQKIGAPSSNSVGQIIARARDQKMDVYDKRDWRRCS